MGHGFAKPSPIYILKRSCWKIHGYPVTGLRVSEFPLSVYLIFATRRVAAMRVYFYDEIVAPDQALAFRGCQRLECILEALKGVQGGLCLAM